MNTHKTSKRKASNKKNHSRGNTKGKRQQARAKRARQRKLARSLDERALVRISQSIFSRFLHHKQVLSIALVTLGIIYTARMTIHAIGAAMAKKRGRGSMKHGIKQVDRFMSNKKLCPVEMMHCLVRAIVGSRKSVDVTMDWTDFDNDGQTTLVLSIVMKHGRAIPIVWHTVRKDTLKSNQSRYERLTVERLRHALPESVHITIIADRGFGSTILFDHLLGLQGIDFIIRFRQNYYFESKTYSGQALDAVASNGRIRVFHQARLTANKKGPYTLVLCKAAKMKEAWCIATSISTCNGKDIVNRYGRRFECEESFRDLKDWRFGLGLKHTKIKNEKRRERLLFAFALAAFLLTIVGLESERQGFDRLLKANTTAKRTLSLFRQGKEIVEGALPQKHQRQCLRAVMRQISKALKTSFYHVMA
jgi:hypothetical protein